MHGQILHLGTRDQLLVELCLDLRHDEKAAVPVLYVVEEWIKLLMHMSLKLGLPLEENVDKEEKTK